MKIWTTLFLQFSLRKLQGKFKKNLKTWYVLHFIPQYSYLFIKDIDFIIVLGRSFKLIMYSKYSFRFAHHCSTPTSHYLICQKCFTFSHSFARIVALVKNLDCQVHIVFCQKVQKFLVHFFL